MARIYIPALLSEEFKENCMKVHDTIVLDDTEDDSQDIIVIEDTHKPTESIQEHNQHSL